MISIVNFKAATNAEGQEFIMLQVQGGVETVLSQETGRYYLTARKAYVSSTFDKRTAESLIGTQMPGGIRREEVEPYSYVIEETGEEITLSHRWVYDPQLQSMEEAVFEDHSSQEMVIA